MRPGHRPAGAEGPIAYDLRSGPGPRCEDHQGHSQSECRCVHRSSREPSNRQHYHIKMNPIVLQVGIPSEAFERAPPIRLCWDVAVRGNNKADADAAEQTRTRLADVVPAV